MDALTYGAARANLAHTMDRVCDDHERLIITRNPEQAVVMLRLDSFALPKRRHSLLRHFICRNTSFASL
jgi:antitoxin YefM